MIGVVMAALPSPRARHLPFVEFGAVPRGTAHRTVTNSRSAGKVGRPESEARSSGTEIIGGLMHNRLGSGQAQCRRSDPRQTSPGPHEPNPNPGDTPGPGIMPP